MAPDPIEDFLDSRVESRSMRLNGIQYRGLNNLQHGLVVADVMGPES